MADFLVYHNPDRMLYSADKVRGASAVTDKPRGAEVLGSRIWLLTGEGQPRTYFLTGCFEITGIEPHDDEEFRTRVVGVWEKKLPRKRWVVLNDEKWFPDFRKKQGNFAFGFQPIRETSFVRGLERALKRAG